MMYTSVNWSILIEKTNYESNSILFERIVFFFVKHSRVQMPQLSYLENWALCEFFVVFLTEN